MSTFARTRSPMVFRLLVCLLCPWCTASDADAQSPKSGAEVDQLTEIVVTGSLIPQGSTSVSMPLTVITADDLQSRGFSSVADALQQTSFATGSVQGPQFIHGFTPGANTLSMFGFSPDFVKYMVDGRPMSDYPALFNNSTVITSIDGIPEELVDRIEILPGGQSSLYGSDAIAGVVNIILRKSLDAPVLDARYGFYKDGGGVSKRFAFADSATLGRLTVMGGVHYERSDPIWAYQRRLTAGYFDQGTSPPAAARDYLILGAFGTDAGDYYFLDPSGCANVAGQFGGSVRRYTRPGHGDYCGTLKAGFNTIDHGREAEQAYLHATYDVNDRFQVYADALLSHGLTRFNAGPMMWESDLQDDWFYDPRLDDFMYLQHAFSPEEIGGLRTSESRLTTNTYSESLGVRGILGSSGWGFSLEATHAGQKLTRRNQVIFTREIAEFFAPLLGPDLGPDPYFGIYPSYSPNYSAFYQPLTPDQYRSFTGLAYSHSRTSYNQVRGQLTSTALFSLPGGNAGAAVAIEWGNQSWSYIPDEIYMTGGVYGYTSATGGGRRLRQAITGEMRLPLWSWFDADLSMRYDDYHVAGQDVGKMTYNLGLQVRPADRWTIRGRYGTAFKAASLADEFQRRSGFQQSATDYYRCALKGYSGPNIGDCDYYEIGVFSTTHGNPALKPITADVWTAGVVFKPLENWIVSADYLHWRIRNQVLTQDPDEILKIESQCLLGTLPMDTPSCVAVLAQIKRDPLTGQITEIFSPKVNVAREAVNAVTLSMAGHLPMGRFGSLDASLSWNDMLKHTFQFYPRDPVIDELSDPTFTTDFKSKLNASLSWSQGPVSSTLYVNRVGRSPNYLATVNGYGAPGAAKLPAWTLCNLSARYQWPNGLQLSVAVDNLFDSMPPLDRSYPGLTSSPYNPFNYNVYGRSYQFEARLRL